MPSQSANFLEASLIISRNLELHPSGFIPDPYQKTEENLEILLRVERQGLLWAEGWVEAHRRMRVSCHVHFATSFRRWVGHIQAPEEDWGRGYLQAWLEMESLLRKPRSEVWLVGLSNPEPELFAQIPGLDHRDLEALQGLLASREPFPFRILSHWQELPDRLKKEIRGRHQFLRKVNPQR